VVAVTPVQVGVRQHLTCRELSLGAVSTAAVGLEVQLLAEVALLKSLNALDAPRLCINYFQGGNDMFKRILVAYDASAAAERALLYAEHVARVENADLTVLHVYQSPDLYATAPGFEALEEALYQVVNNFVKDAVTGLLEAGFPNVHILVRKGASTAVILQVAEEMDAQLIVMGSRGLTQVEDLLGSVSLHVLRNAQRPVLIIP